ncbi:MAG TPA: hypothetical protein VKE94_15410 [Gemmataceae bacterium]|nr:hypothetical protein [Gemmataceae bacterium]
MIAAYLRDTLPPPHLTKESQDVVRLGMGLVATMTALLLGIVTAAARSTFDNYTADIRTSAVNILTLDRHLARSGPETKSIRELIQRAVAFRVEAIWPSGGPSSNGLGEPLSTAAVEEIENQLLQLSPQTESQRWFREEALRLSNEVLKMRWRVLEGDSSLPQTFLNVVIFWLMATFVSFGLYAPRNATVLSVLLIAALSVAAAVFLIVELDGPFDGLIQVSGEPLRFALSNLGH